MKSILAFLAIMLIVAVVPAAVFAVCPDQAKCYYYHKGDSFGIENIYDEVGSIETSTCYKDATCRPWHCPDNTTNSDHWIEQCIQTFSITHKDRNDKACVLFTTIRDFAEFAHRYCKSLGD